MRTGAGSVQEAVLASTGPIATRANALAAVLDEMEDGGATHIEIDVVRIYLGAGHVCHNPLHDLGVAP